jgi:hypothetical protein
MTRNKMVRGLCSSLAIAVGVLLGTAGVAVAAPELKVTPVGPDYVMPGSGLAMFVNVQNVGDQPLDGTLTIRATFPDGIFPANFETFNSPADPLCDTVGQTVTCTVEVTGVLPGVQLRYRVNTSADPGASGPLPSGLVEVFGGGSSDTFSEPLDMVAGPAGPFALQNFDVGLSPTLTGLSPARAGSAPMEILTRFESLSEAKATFGIPVPATLVIAPTENFRDVTVHVPRGLVGNPSATPVRCAQSQLTTPTLVNGSEIGVPACPPESQVGVAQLNSGDIVGVFNLKPPAGYPAAFGFFYNSVVVTMLAEVRPSDHGIDIVVEKSVSSIPLPKVEVTLWGAPSDPSHDPLRGACLFGGGGHNTTQGDCSLKTRNDIPFLRTPTSCPGTPLAWGIDMTTYQQPDTLVHAETSSPPVEGCELNPFAPAFALSPSTKAPHAPSGVDAAVTMDQDWSVHGIAPADLKRATVTLPEGMTINPSSADGLQACTDTQLRLKQEGPAVCPDASKLGTVTVQSPLLDHPIGGSIFLRSQNSNDPMSGELFRLAVEIRSDPDGIAIRLPGAVKADPVTGRLTTVFDSLPQLPFESMNLHFKTGPRAPLASPSECATHTTGVQLVSWGEKVVNTTSSFETVGCKAPRFEPTLAAGIENPVAGTSSPLHVRLTRSDDDSHFRSLSIDTPKGLLGRIRDVDQCSSPAADAGACPASSRIGRATVGAGVGPNPFFLDTGRVYLTEGYKGAPYGLAVVVDAVAGPFSLGKVIVRQAVHVDRTTAQLKVVSDPFPTILKGVPLRIRTVRVAIDKPNFVVSPTNCKEQRFGGTATAVNGATAPLASRFQIGDCSRLAFTPRLGLRLTGRKQRRTGGHPGVRAVVRQAKGQANIARARVVLPKSLALDPSNARALCEFEDGIKPDLEDHCPKGSIVGRARARTPLLERPLVGDVYFVKNVRVDKTTGNKIRTLPMLIVALRGEIAINLKGTSSVRGGRLVNMFASVPDAPVTQFNLNIKGGDNGILLVTENARGRIDICTRRQTANVRMAGQNAKRANFRVRVKTPCTAASRKAKRH